MRDRAIFSAGVRVAVIVTGVMMAVLPAHAEGLPELLQFNTTKKAGDRFAAGDDQQAQIMTDDGTEIRLGERSEVMKVWGKREFEVKGGAMMLAVPKKKIFGGSTKITTPGSEITLKGTTAIVEYVKEVYIKIICIEGSLKVALKALMGEWVMVGSGQMLIVNPADVRLPDPVEVDLRRLVETSSFASGNFSGMPNAALVTEAITQQAARIADGTLLKTQLIIPSRGTRVELGTESLSKNSVADRLPAPPPPVAAQAVEVVQAPPPSVQRGNGGGTPPAQGRELPPPGPYVIDETTVWNDGSVTTPGAAPVAAERMTVDGSQDRFVFPDFDDSTDDLALVRDVTVQNPGGVDEIVLETPGSLKVGGEAAAILAPAALLPGAIVVGERTTVGFGDPAPNNIVFKGDTEVVVQRADITTPNSVAFLSDNQVSFDDATVTAGGAIRGESTGGSVSVVDSRFDGGDVSLSGVNDLTISGVDTSITGNGVTLGGAAVTVTDAGVAAASTLRFNAPGGTVGIANADLSGGEVFVAGAGGLGASPNEVTITGSMIDALTGLSIVSDGLLRLDGSDLTLAGGQALIDGRTIELNNTRLNGEEIGFGGTSEGLTIGGGSELTGTDVVLDSQGPVSVDGATVTGSNLAEFSSFGESVTVNNATVNSGGRVTLGVVSGGGGTSLVRLTGTNNIVGRDIMVGSEGGVESVGGTLTGMVSFLIDAGGDVVLDGTVVRGGSVQLAVAGNITTRNLTDIQGADVDLIGGGTVGVDNSMVVAANNLVVGSSGSGVSVLNNTTLEGDTVMIGRAGTASVNIADSRVGSAAGVDINVEGNTDIQRSDITSAGGSGLNVDSGGDVSVTGGNFTAPRISVVSGRDSLTVDGTTFSGDDVFLGSGGSADVQNSTVGAAGSTRVSVSSSGPVTIGGSSFTADTVFLGGGAGLTISNSTIDAQIFNDSTPAGGLVVENGTDITVQQDVELLVSGGAVRVSDSNVTSNTGRVDIGDTVTRGDAEMATVDTANLVAVTGASVVAQGRVTATGANITASNGEVMLNSIGGQISATGSMLEGTDVTLLGGAEVTVVMTDITASTPAGAIGIDSAGNTVSVDGGTLTGGTINIGTIASALTVDGTTFVGDQVVLGSQGQTDVQNVMAGSTGSTSVVVAGGGAVTVGDSTLAADDVGLGGAGSTSLTVSGTAIDAQNLTVQTPGDVMVENSSGITVENGVQLRPTTGGGLVSVANSTVRSNTGNIAIGDQMVQLDSASVDISTLNASSGVRVDADGEIMVNASTVTTSSGDVVFNSTGSGAGAQVDVTGSTLQGENVTISGNAPINVAATDINFMGASDPDIRVLATDSQPVTVTGGTFGGSPTRFADDISVGGQVTAGVGLVGASSSLNVDGTTFVGLNVVLGSAGDVNVQNASVPVTDDGSSSGVRIGSTGGAVTVGATVIGAQGPVQLGDMGTTSLALNGTTIDGASRLDVVSQGDITVDSSSRINPGSSIILGSVGAGNIRVADSELTSPAVVDIGDSMNSGATDIVVEASTVTAPGGILIGGSEDVTVSGATALASAAGPVDIFSDALTLGSTATVAVGDATGTERVTVDSVGFLSVVGPAAVNVRNLTAAVTDDPMLSDPSVTGIESLEGGAVSVDASEFSGNIVNFGSQTSASVDISATAVTAGGEAFATATDRVTVTGGSVIEALNDVSLVALTGDVTVADSMLSSGDGRVQLGVAETTVGTQSVSVTNSNITADEGVFAAADGGVTVDSSTLANNNSKGAAGGRPGLNEVSITSRSNDAVNPGIVIRNTSELRALGEMALLRMQTNGAGIQVADSTLLAALDPSGGSAEPSEILIDTVNTAISSMVELRNATLTADIIRARSAGPSGELIINGSTFDATQLIRLYGNGALRFVGANSTLNAETIDLAGRIIRIDSGITVNANGPNLNVYTDGKQFNFPGETDGTVGNLNTSTPEPGITPFDMRPAFR